MQKERGSPSSKGNPLTSSCPGHPFYFRSTRDSGLCTEQTTYIPWLLLRAQGAPRVARLPLEIRWSGQELEVPFVWLRFFGSALCPRGWDPRTGPLAWPMTVSRGGWVGSLSWPPHPNPPNFPPRSRGLGISVQPGGSARPSPPPLPWHLCQAKAGHKQSQSE